MCNEAAWATKTKELWYGEHYLSQEELDRLADQAQRFLQGMEPTYHASGFSHPEIPVITNDNPDRFQFFKWGLIPFFIKKYADAYKISNQCLNARGETIWDKPSFREAAKKRRCLITCIDGFYEYHHAKGKTYPFFIKLKKDEPMTFAGLWEKWEDKNTGITVSTTTIVTTEANDMMRFIHNNERALTEGARMPVILPKELHNDWLRPMNDKVDKELLQELIKPYEQEEMEAWPVRQLKGKNGVGNSPIAMEAFEYDELPY